MTKRKAIMYLIIFAVLVTAAQTWKTNYLSDPASKLPDPCKMVISSQCQQYINKITAEKKYEETVAIQKIRIISKIALKLDILKEMAMVINALFLYSIQDYSFLILLLNLQNIFSSNVTFCYMISSFWVLFYIISFEPLYMVYFSCKFFSFFTAIFFYYKILYH